MNSERIKTIASFIDKNDIVLDVGCDHGYLSIYLTLNNLAKKVIASDISKNALNVAKRNFLKYNLDIETILSDGFNNIEEDFNTAVIAGMGTNSILEILNNQKRVEKLVLASNNDYYYLRKRMNKLGYTLNKERIVYENNHYYVIMLYTLGKERLSYAKLLFGISNNKQYYEYLINKNRELLKKVPFKKKVKIYKELFILKGLIGKK